MIYKLLWRLWTIGASAALLVAAVFGTDSRYCRICSSHTMCLYRVWDWELASVAQRWVDQCTFAHDLCRDLERYPVGQNLFVQYSTHAPKPPQWKAAINNWYSEVSFFDTANLVKFTTLGAAGHYSQLVTASSWLLGCGQLSWLEADTATFTQLYVCNYGPSGNLLGLPVYTVGRPCSRCPPGHVCSHGLCESLFRGRG